MPVERLYYRVHEYLTPYTPNHPPDHPDSVIDQEPTSSAKCQTGRAPWFKIKENLPHDSDRCQLSIVVGSASSWAFARLGIKLDRRSRQRVKIRSSRALLEASRSQHTRRGPAESRLRRKYARSSSAGRRAFNV
ncbi:hypothetical protein KM043_009629 [Ampulex compressa]|nr:hypothetical protein KM043_009629 [Ampulex compressa]